MAHMTATHLLDIPRSLQIDQVTHVVHEASRAYCQALGDESQPAWGSTPDCQRDSITKDVLFCLANPNAGPDQLHAKWREERGAMGWVYGPVEDPVAKEHPYCVPYDQLPLSQRIKYHLLAGVVRAMAISEENMHHEHGNLVEEINMLYCENAELRNEIEALNQRGDN